ncbi:MAG: peptidase M6 immune inhibitor A [Sporichthyaceae bacterium]
MRMRHLRAVCGLASVGLIVGLTSTVVGGTARAQDPPAEGVGAVDDIVRLPDTLRFPLAANTADVLKAWQATPAGAAQFNAAAENPKVGDKRMWPSLDQVQGTVYLKEYTLRGQGKGIEVWVASGAGPDGIVGTDFRAEDCRNVIPGSTVITDAQVKRLVGEYDRKMFPKMSKAFSVAPNRDGSKPEENELTKGLTFNGAGNNTVTLVDNVRDPNFYDFPKNQTYVAGFFSRQFNELTDRNIMTIDAYDWAHRTGDNPKDEQNDDICKSRPARANQYEGVFAHEYQHLLHYYTDPDEGNFLNEGLSDYAESLVGYGDTRATVFQKGQESHLTCYNGFGTVGTRFNPNPQACGGPQNSLTMWGDEGEGSEILADYGAAWSFLLYVRDKYGAKILEDLHRDSELQGMKSVQAALDKHAKGVKAADVLHDFQLSTLLDKLVSGGSVTGIDRRKVVTPSLNSAVNLLNPASYVAGGVAPNGADFVPLRGTGAAFLKGSALNSLSFAGAKTLKAAGLQWSVEPKIPLLGQINPPALPNVPPQEPIVVPDVPLPTDRPALFSGNTGNLDATAVLKVKVPADNATLSYTSFHNTEENFDWAYTVVSTDGGKTYKSLANANTKPVTGPAPDGNALTGTSGIPVVQTFDLAEYAGKDVLLGFRYVSDPLINNGGWYVNDVKLGTETILDGSETTGLKSFTQIRPIAVPKFTVTLVGIDEAGKRAHVQRVKNVYDMKLSAAARKKFASYPVLVAVISLDDIAERLTGYAPYLLRVNGIIQEGGRIS